MKNILLASILISSIIVASGVLAISRPTPESTPGSGGPTTEARGLFSGIIASVNERGETIVVKGNAMMAVKTLTFSVDNKTKITKSRSSIALRDLKKDMPVTIEYRQEMGKLTAIMINVTTP